VLSVARVGETITYSAGVLIAATALTGQRPPSASTPELAAPLAIAIALMLLAGLTLLPALLAICGPVAFWPSSVRPGGRPARVVGARPCSRIVRRPGDHAGHRPGSCLWPRIAAASAGYLAAGFGGAATGPAGSDSAAGNAPADQALPSDGGPTRPSSCCGLRQPRLGSPRGPWPPRERQLAGDAVFSSVSGAAERQRDGADRGPSTPRCTPAYGPAARHPGLGPGRSSRRPGPWPRTGPTAPAAPTSAADGRTISFATPRSAAGQRNQHRGGAGGARRPGGGPNRAGAGGRRYGLRGDRAGGVHLRRRASCPAATCGRSYRSPVAVIAGAARAGDALADRTAVT